MNNNEQLNLLRIFFLISGILNILFGISWIFYTIIGGLVTCGFGCLFGVIPVLNIIACVMDFVVYGRLNRMDRSGTYSSLQFAAIFDIITILTGNVASMIFGIVALVFMNNDEVTRFMKEKGIY
jgi:hypothetical protein